jgi:hypothetical protein
MRLPKDHNELQRMMARIAEEDGMHELAKTLEKDAGPKSIQDRRSRGWAVSRYRMPEKAE